MLKLELDYMSWAGPGFVDMTSARYYMRRAIPSKVLAESCCFKIGAKRRIF